MDYKLLVINPGSTSTKIAYYEGGREIYFKSIEHKTESLQQFQDVLDQLGYRSEILRNALAEWGVSLSGLSAVVGRGNMLPHMKSGGYLVTDSMIAALKAGEASPHASNLGALLSDSIACPLGIPAYIYDSVTADEFIQIAKITGMPGVERESMCHVLNQRATARKFAESIGRGYEDLKLLVVHMGGGITVGIHSNGKIIDCMRDDDGPFSPERTGSVPLLYVVDICYSGKYTKKEMIRFVRGNGGLKAYLGTSDCREIEAMIEAGDQRAKLLYEAQAYQIAKGIGVLSIVLNGKYDYIILTGGMAYSEMMTAMIKERVEFIAPVVIIPGENEMDALAAGAARLLDGERCRVYGKDEIA